MCVHLKLMRFWISHVLAKAASSDASVSPWVATGWVLAAARKSPSYRLRDVLTKCAPRRCSRRSGASSPQTPAPVDTSAGSLSSVKRFAIHATPPIASTAPSSAQSAPMMAGLALVCCPCIRPRTAPNVYPLFVGVVLPKSLW